MISGKREYTFFFKAPAVVFVVVVVVLFFFFNGTSTGLIDLLQWVDYS